MPSLDDVADLAAALPETTERERRGSRSWSVGDKTFVWERTYSKADIKRFGAESYPAEPIIAITVEDLGEKEAILATAIPGVFTISHFDGYSAVLVELAAIAPAALRELVVDGWRAVAPHRLSRLSDPFAPDES